MKGFTDYDRHDGLGLAELLRRGEVSAVELVEAAIARIEARNPRLNAVILKAFDMARTAAEKAPRSGPFAGVPLLVKDLVSPVAGLPMQNGSRYYRGFVPVHDSELIRRYREAGFIVIGKTNTPELGLVPVTEPEAFGPTLNPWDVSRTPGGSSGGSAAAVAARMVPIAHGGDGGGSIRIPASCCGLFGLKPTRGRNPLGPDVGESWHGATVEHVLTRSVRDSAAVLDASAGPDPGAPYYAPAPARPYLQEVGAPPGRLRIAFGSRTLTGDPVHPDCLAALRDAAKLCAELGHEVVEDFPAVDPEQMIEPFVLLIAGEAAAEIAFGAELVGRKARRGDLETSTALLALLGRTYSAADLAGAVRTLQRVGRATGPFFQKYDLLLTPTLGQPPVPIGALDPPGWEAAAQEVFAALHAGRLLKLSNAIRISALRIFRFMPFTPMWNITGQPAMSVPLFWNAAGLPIGVQFVGRYADEATLFRLAAQLEAARPWAGRVPAMPSA